MTNALQRLENLEALASWRQEARLRGLNVGLVPTMGNLHAGHISLIAAARKAHDLVIATLFVNPLQFGPNEDLAKYPRTFDADCHALQAAGCDALFIPTTQMLYPNGLQAQTSISVPGLSTLHCGKTRPGHFDGVCTVVCKLFNLVQADRAYFGLKDYQQFSILKRMVSDLNLPVALTGLPTIREPDGLALSSRNGYLTPSQRQMAPALYRTLQQAASTICGGNTDLRQVENWALEQLEAEGLRPDYFTICERGSLVQAQTQNTPLVILAAAYLGTTRLIDNLEV